MTVAATAGNGHGVGAVTGVSLTLTDDDVAGIVTSPVTSAASRVRTSEDGSTATVDVTLATEPTGDVRMDVASSDTAQGTVDTDPNMNGDQSTLTFTATNWYIAQTVTLTGVDDSPGAADGSQTYTVSLTVDTANTADANYDALSAVTIHAVNADDELGLDVGAVSGPATEAGGTATFTVRLVADPALATQASQAVTVSVTSRDGSEGRVSPSSLIFTAGASGTWNVNRTVTVTGVDDAIDDGDVAWDVRLDTSSAAGSDYAGVPDVDVSVTTTDDDDAPAVTLSLSPTSIAESGGTATVRAVLSRASSSATTVTVTGVPGFYTPGSDATIVIPAGATTSTDTATVEAVDDAVYQGAGGRQATVTATVANDRAAADGETMTVTGAALTLTDDDEKGLVLDPEEVTAAEGGTAGYTVALSSEPTGNVSVSVTSDNADVTVSSPSLPLTFTTSNWNEAQTVTVTAAVDGDDFADTATVSHSASGGGYDGEAGTVEGGGVGGGGHEGGGRGRGGDAGVQHRGPPGDGGGRGRRAGRHRGGSDGRGGGAGHDADLPAVVRCLGGGGRRLRSGAGGVADGGGCSGVGGPGGRCAAVPAGNRGSAHGARGGARPGAGAAAQWGGGGGLA